MKLYHYTTLDKFLKLILHSEGVNHKARLRFGSFDATNDLFEFEEYFTYPKDYPVIGLFYSTQVRDTFRAERLKYKLLCFSMDKDSGKKGNLIPPLWGHYGDKNKGVCLCIDKEKLQSQLISSNIVESEISYDEIRLFELPAPAEDANSIEDYLQQIPSHIETHCQNLLFKKDTSWRYEQEYRILYKDNDGNADNFLDITDALVCVYIGAQIDILSQEFKLLVTFLQKYYPKTEIKKMHTTISIDGTVEYTVSDAKAIWEEELKSQFFSKSFKLRELFEFQESLKHFIKPL